MADREGGWCSWGALEPGHMAVLAQHAVLQAGLGRKGSTAGEVGRSWDCLSVENTVSLGIWWETAPYRSH